jgi:hypothetical protein
MKKLFCLILAITLLTAPLCDAEPAPDILPQPGTPAGPSENAAKIVLTPPSTAKVGELVRLDASASTATSYKWLTNPVSADFEVFAGGRKAVFSARKPGSYTFTLAVAYKDTVDVVSFTVIVEGPIAPPTTESLEAWIPYWRADMDLPEDKLEALAVSFEQISLKMTVLATPEVIIKASAEANRAALGDSLPQFIPLLQKIQASLEKLAKSGQLKTPEQHAAVWQEIARGLRK